MIQSFRFSFILFSCAAAFLGHRLFADEGMWLLNAPPSQALKQHYGFEVTPQWTDHVQRASVKLPSGSGSFVSSTGLIITNQHVVSGLIEKVSSAEKNYLKQGYCATSPEKELKLPGAYVDILISIEDVTSKINSVVNGLGSAEALAARKAVVSTIEKESLEQTGLRSTVVTLYQGGVYHLYRYKRYTDLRLVFTPEEQASLFGGDPDNFEFPRYDFDVAFVRAYEKDQAVRPEDFFKVSQNGANSDELVFVTGHPGKTSRSLTVRELEFLRDVYIPKTLEYITLHEVLFSAWAARSKENSRHVEDELMTVQNARKMHFGRYSALLEESLIKNKITAEQSVKAFAQSRPEFSDALGAWETIDKAEDVLTKTYSEYSILESYFLGSTLCKHGRRIYRGVTEKLKPSGERLREYRDASLANLELGFLSNAPIDLELERIKLTAFFLVMVRELGYDHPATRIALAGKSPEQRAGELISHTHLQDLAYRKKLYSMTPAQLDAEDDPILALVRAVDGQGRAIRKITDEQTEVKEQAHAAIEKVLFAKNGGTAYPDATGSLRLCYGTVTGYSENGKPVAPFTTIGSMYTHSRDHDGREPFDLPTQWKGAESTLDASCPFNFVSTCDIIGGSSGSPVLNTQADLVGIIFDENIHSLAGEYGYSGEQARAIAVDIRAIREVLKKVYSADALLAELGE